MCWGGPSYLYSQKPGRRVGVGRPTCTVRSQVGVLGWAVLPVQSQKPGRCVGVGRPTCTVRSQVGVLGWAVLPVQSEAR